MKHMKIKVLAFLLILAGLWLNQVEAKAQNNLTAKEIIEKADLQMQGSSSFSIMSMTIRRPTWERTLEFKNWSKGRQLALTLVTAPAKEKGQTFLKRDKDMWNYLPGINRLIKLPPSMMSQGWMGSDYSNDDVLNQSSVVNDYHHSVVGSEVLEERDCYRIELLPTEESAVVWGKVMVWVSKKDFVFMKSEYYDEDLLLVKTELAGDIKTMDGRPVATRLEIIPADEPGHKTVVNIQSIDFDLPLDDNFFSQQNMKTIR